LPEPDEKINQSCGEEIALENQLLIDRPLTIQFLTKVLTERYD